MNSKPVAAQRLQKRAPTLPAQSPAGVPDGSSSIDERETPAMGTLAELPDEALVAIVNQLSVTDSEDLTSLRSLGLTCRKLSDIVFDKMRLQMAVRAELPKVVKLLPQYDWNTLRQAATFNKFQRSSRQLVDGFMHRGIHDPSRWRLYVPLGGWQNIIEVGLLLNEKMMGRYQLTSHDSKTIRDLVPVEKLVLLYSAVLFAEVFLSSMGDLVEVPRSSLLQTAFMTKGPEFLLEMYRGLQFLLRDDYIIPAQRGDWQGEWLTDYFDNYTEDESQAARSLGKDVETDMKQWAQEGTIEQDQSFKDIGIEEDGRTTLLECVDSWAKMNWRDLPWNTPG